MNPALYDKLVFILKKKIIKAVFEHKFLPI